MVHPQDMDGGDGFQIRKVAANTAYGISSHGEQTKGDLPVLGLGGD
jgi:hypothetical protein